MNKCEQCLKDVPEELRESDWEDGVYVCNECYDQIACDVWEYIEDNYYACVHGCCKCCGCSCR